MSTQQLHGIHVVHGLLTTQPQRVRQVYLSAERQDQRIAEIEELARNFRVPVERLPRRQFERQAGDVRHQGVLAACVPLEPMSEPQMLSALSSMDTPPLILVLDGITDPHNLGAILRTADAAGVDCVITARDNSASLSPAVRKVASGAAENVPFCAVANLKRTLKEIKTLGIWLYGAAGEGRQTYTQIDYRGAAALVVGAEGKGLRRLTRDACDELVQIPMAGTVSSLNVSVATGVFVYEAVRQRAIESQ
jgi:23S rRNA (guanosine2251-2'-O)-methyltransferase